MANKPTKIYYKDEALYTKLPDCVIRVAFDKANMTYLLYKGDQRITSRTNKDNPDRALKDIAREFYKLVEKPNTIQIEQHHLQPKVQKQLKVTWLYISDKDGRLHDYLSKFYKQHNEYSYWYEILESRYKKKKDSSYEPMIIRFNEIKTECYILYNAIKSKEYVLQHVCDNLNKHIQSWNSLSIDRLKERVLKTMPRAVKYIKDPEEKELWNKALYAHFKNPLNNNEIKRPMKELLNKFYQNKLFYTDGKSVYIMSQTIDKEYIAKQFAKLFRVNMHSTAILAGMPEMLEIPEEKIGDFKKGNIKRYAFDDILNAYKDRANKPPSDKSKKDAESWLNEFLCICSAKANKQIMYVDEITDEQIESYTTEIYKVATLPKYKYKAVWLSKNQIKYLEKRKKYPKAHWQTNRISMLKNLLTNAIKELIQPSNIEEAAAIDRILFRLKHTRIIDRQSSPT